MSQTLRRIQGRRRRTEAAPAVTVYADRALRMLKRAAIAAIALACATGALADAETECQGQGLSGTPDQVIVACSQVIKADSRAARTYFNRGLAYQDKGDLDRAIVDYRKALELEPKNGDAWRMLG